jgi:hypothetical protein
MTRSASSTFTPWHPCYDARARSQQWTAVGAVLGQQGVNAMPVEDIAIA